MSTRWTADQVSAYAKRQLAASANARREIREKATPKTRNGYNQSVVLAFFREYGVPEPEFEFRFDLTRRWKFDMAWITGLPLRMVFLEVQGSIFTGGRHTRGPALLREYEKINRASVLGWRGLFVTPQQLLTHQTASMVRECLGLCPVPDRHVGMAKNL